MGPSSCMRALSSSCGLRKPTQGETAPEIPSDAWQLANAIGHSGDKAGSWRAHVVSLAVAPLSMRAPLARPHAYSSAIPFSANSFFAFLFLVRLVDVADFQRNMVEANDARFREL